jgi:prepilin signal peptidase PulO-like enzyme (type II secretory pathway)
MALTVALFALTIVLGHGDYVDRDISSVPFILNLIAYGMLTVGGWLGGTIVFVHGMRVLNLTEEAAMRAVSPVPKPEKEAAEN